MLSHKGFDVKDQVIKEDKFLTVSDASVEVFEGDGKNILCERFLAFEGLLVSKFKRENDQSHDGHVKILKREITRMGRVHSVKVNSCRYSKIRPDQDEVSKPLMNVFDHQ